MRRILLTGMSATGKSTITAAIAARGYKAVDLDSDAWSHWVDVVEDNAPGTPVGAGRDWVWRDDRVGKLLAEEGASILVISGCSPNQGQFYPQLDAVVLLSAPEPVVAMRLAARTGNNYGKGAGETERVLELIREVEPILRDGATHEIDTSGTFDDVLDAVLRIVDPRS
ncbi:AAA family ATPase [Devosia sp. Root105]|uniref:AAA family ATPase n=1 Tax=Devosia sp. Root105 TaxID=1736423 RepID=UPI0009E6BC52|nr:AAA family ATPase [Devosia sp. Root105]